MDITIFYEWSLTTIHSQLALINIDLGQSTSIQV